VVREINLSGWNYLHISWLINSAKFGEIKRAESFDDKIPDYSLPESQCWNLVGKDDCFFGFDSNPDPSHVINVSGID
jgi:hypothetical protein